MSGEHPPEYVHNHHGRDYSRQPCLACPLGTPRHPNLDGPKFNDRTLKRQNREGKTTREEEREAIGDRWDDPRIGKADF